MKAKKLISALLLTAVAGTAVAAVTLTACKKNPENQNTGRTLYVSADGDENATGTIDDPLEIVDTFRSDSLQPGDTLLVLPGEHKISLRTTIVASGTHDNYITIKPADPTKETKLSFYGMLFASTNRGMQIYGNYIHWDGVDICGAGDNGMYIGGSYNIIENCKFYDNRDTGLQLGRSYSPDGSEALSVYNDINYWPSYNLIKNCTSYNNYDNETYGENADGFAAKLTVGYGNVFDGCIAYRNSDDGWDLYAKTDSGNIGAVIMYNCVAFENGFIMEKQEDFNKKFPSFNRLKQEDDPTRFYTRDGDGNGFKLGGSVMEGEVFMYNCLSFNNRMHGVTDNSNPGVLSIDQITSYNNGANVDATGKITYATGNGIDDGCGNIDVARWNYSYNHIANVLSVNNGNPFSAYDEYRGTVDNSTLYRADKDDSSSFKAYSITKKDEYSTKAGDNGVAIEAPKATDLFKELPTLDLGLDTEWHVKWRNEDGSINLGNLLALKDASGTQGSTLNKTSWDAYKHYEMHDLTKCASADDAVAQAVIDMTYVPVNLSCVYQDFDVVTKIANVEITWTSSNSSILEISNIKGTSNSKHQDVKVIVNRPTDGDKKVTLTATVKVGDVTKERKFEVTVMRNAYRVGEIQIADLVEGNIIIDKQETATGYRLQAPVVTNGTSNSGAIISSDLYDRLPTVKFASYSNPTNFQTVADGRFKADQSGIWEITETITLRDTLLRAKNPDGSTVDVTDPESWVWTTTYKVYVADKAASVDFSGSASSIAVNKDGFTITGNFTSPTGNIYAVTKPAGAATPTAAEIKADEKAVKKDFRAVGSTFDFEADNTKAYDVFYFLESVDETQASKVYKKSIKTQAISTKADFQAMLNSNDTQTIYLLQNDIDFEGSISPSDKAFVSVFNGQGHTLKNIKIEKTVENDKQYTGLFRQVTGGTIINVTFEDIHIKDVRGKAERTGIIAQIKGGYVGNITLHNIDIEGNSRVGGLIGQIYSEKGETETCYVDRISVISDKDADGNYLHKITATNQRAGGVVGYIQNGDGAGWNVAYITNCYIDTQIEALTSYCGGVVGRYDDRNKNDYLEITNSLFVGLIRVPLHCGGIIGGISGAGKARIVSCVGLGTFYYTEFYELVETSSKNCSNIVGNCGSNADARVVNCYAPFSEANASFSVTVFGEEDDEGNRFSYATEREFWIENLTTYQSGLATMSTKWDFENVWQLVEKENDPSTIVKPYATLR